MKSGISHGNTIFIIILTHYSIMKKFLFFAVLFCLLTGANQVNAQLIIRNSLQNITFSKNQYVIANDVIAGKFVNSNRTPGNVVVKSGIEYEIESSGTVTLQDGFSVEKGATFAVYPSSY